MSTFSISYFSSMCVQVTIGRISFLPADERRRDTERGRIAVTIGEEQKRNDWNLFPPETKGGQEKKNDEEANERICLYNVLKNKNLSKVNIKREFIDIRRRRRKKRGKNRTLLELSDWERSTDCHGHVRV